MPNKKKLKTDLKMYESFYIKYHNYDRFQSFFIKKVRENPDISIYDVAEFFICASQYYYYIMYVMFCPIGKLSTIDTEYNWRKNEQLLYQ